ncbi:MAG TPA: DUF885 domain-containing protein [Vitreimonas sp.]|nr:DUF885 domain-containing protein [Vitreimonas sp.]
MSDFSARVDVFFGDYFRLSPVEATAAGLHDHDGRWPDLTEDGRLQRAEAADRWSAELGAFEDADLTADERVDRDVLLLELAAQRFEAVELREETWNPMWWVYLLGSGIFPLLAREFAPLPDRLRSVAGRLAGIPALLDAARVALSTDAGRPVARLHTETAIRQLAGVTELVDDAVQQAEARSNDPGVADVLPGLRDAAEEARTALAHFEDHLRDDVIPRSEGEGRLGADLFAAKMRHTMRSDELTPDRILAAAEREFDAVRHEMTRLAREGWSRWFPDREPPLDEGRLVRDVLDRIATDHTTSDGLLDFCREELGQVEAFCRERNLIGLPDEPLEIRWTPAFLRSFAGAMLDSPGPLDRDQKSFFSITPIPEDWSPEQAESYLREMNAKQLVLLTIHEAVPGHYLQGVYANRLESLPRAVFWSGLYAEGWAVYVTQVMMDQGYRADDPGVLLNHWKYYLRAVVNAIIDARIHTADMTEDEAVALMVDGGFQEEAEARAKYNRARLSSTQLSTYFVGSMEFWSIEREARQRAAVAARDPRGADAVPEPRVVGGFGDTPAFDYRAHLEGCISHGSPPTSVLRRILLP